MKNVLKQLEKWLAIFDAWQNRHSALIQIVCLYTLVIGLLLWPFLTQPTFGVVDDGYSLLKGRQIVTSRSVSDLKSALIESNLGRVRPVYLLYFAIMYVLYGSDPIGLWFGQTLVIIGTCFVIYKVAFMTSGKKWLSILLPLPWLFMPTVLENVYRLGTAEPRQLLFLLLAILFFLYFQTSKKSAWLLGSIGMAILALGTKETSLILLPFYGIYLLHWLWQKVPAQKRVLAIVAGFGLLVVVGLVGINLIHTTGYVASNVAFDRASIALKIYQSRFNFPQYYLLAWLVLASFGIRVGFAVYRQKLVDFIERNLFSFALFAAMFGSLFFNILWTIQMERYMYPFWTFTLLLGIVEFKWWTTPQLSKSSAKKGASPMEAKLLLWTVVIIFFGYTVLLQNRGLNYIAYAQRDVAIARQAFDVTQNENSIITKLLANQTATTLYTTNDNYEVIYELGVYLSQFGARPVTVVQPSKELSLNEPNYLYTPNPYLAYNLDPSPTKILVGRIADLQERPVASAAVQLNPPVKYKMIKPDQYWWILEPK